MKLDLPALKRCLNTKPEVIAAYLFGSAAKGESAVNDVDILVLLRPDIDMYKAFYELNYSISEALSISEDRIDLLFLNLDEAKPVVLYNAINQGILLKNIDADMLSDRIEAVSRHLLENEPMILQAKRLRQDRLEAFCAS
jgi:predicted nucleotidyltransferase